MLQGLSEVEGGGSVLPFVKLFYSSPSMYWWTDDAGGTHEVWQGEGGEQGDPLMPALYACGQHRALVNVSEELLDSERLFALWMTCTCVVALIVLLPFTSCWNERCGTVQGSNSTKEKLSSGTEAALPLMVGRQ